MRRAWQLCFETAQQEPYYSYFLHIRTFTVDSSALTEVTQNYFKMMCAKYARLCLAGNCTLSQEAKFAYCLQPFLPRTSRSISNPLGITRTSSYLLQDHVGTKLTARSNQKQYSKISDERSTPGTETSARLTAKWKWVIRGGYKVAAFDAADNRAIAMESTDTKYLHQHVCSNCKTTYDHSHPYKSLAHPQHIKDCPQCKTLAPSDVELKR